MNEVKRPSTIERTINRLKQYRFLATFIAIIGLIVYLVNAFQTVISKLSFLDEGLYLYKGWLVVSGKYQLFENYGLWTNHMPFSFLIPGTAQVIFGPGLRTGRYFAIAIAVIFLIGLYFVIRKSSNTWWAAIGIWIYALNPASIKIYSMALTEGIVAAMFIWMIFLGVIPDRRKWQIICAGFLSAFILLTRENMLVVFPLFVLYVWWQHGWKLGLAAFLAGMVPIIVINAIYWPNILEIWAMWIPRIISPILNPWRLISDGVFLLNQIPDKASNLTERMVNLGVLLRNHFASFFMFFIFCIFLPKIKELRNHKEIKSLSFLVVAYCILLGMHSFAAFGLDYCVSCILLYIDYFGFLPLIFLPMGINLLIKKPGPIRKLIFGGFILLFFGGIVISSIDDFMKSTIFNGSSVFGKVVDLGALLIQLIQTRFNLRYYQAVRVELVAILVVISCILIILGILFLRFKSIRRKMPSTFQFAFGFLGLGILLSPTILLGKANDFFACKSDVITSYEKAGKELREIIPAGEKVYWEGRSDAIFLYLPDIEIYPPQLNHLHAYYQNGDSDSLLRLGRYNNLLADQWYEGSNYILLEKEYAKKWEMDAIAADRLTQISDIPPLGNCESAGHLELFIRN